MPKSMTNAEHDFRYETIVQAEGEECIVCHMEHIVPRKQLRRVYKSPRGFRFEIDHADNDRTNWDWENIHLVCKKHNCTLRGMTTSAHLTLMQAYRVQLEREREREGLTTWKSITKDMISFDGAPTVVQLNRRYRPIWIRYVIGLLTAEHSFDRTRLIVNAANKAGCSKQTSENYLAVEAADDGLLKITLNRDGEKIVVLRHLPAQLPPPPPPAKGKKTK